MDPSRITMRLIVVMLMGTGIGIFESMHSGAKRMNKYDEKLLEFNPIEWSDDIINEQNPLT